MSFFELSDDDAMKLIFCETHLGKTNSNFQSEQYIYKRKVNGI